jgi:GNAT superfamily N-acetyltransferase
MAEIVFKATDSREAVEAVQKPLLASNDIAAGRPAGYFPFAFHIVDDGEVLGGATGYGSFDWVFLELLFVPESLRGKGVGSELLARVEAFAREHKMLGVWLDTFSFQARPFYERHGYTVFGTIDSHPSGGQRFFLQKRLDANYISVR